jgi:hypothetical protein
MKDLIWLCCEPFNPICIDKDTKKIVIGRYKGCDFVLPHKSVSREHAIVKRIQNILVIEDLKSSNGTLVNNRKVTFFPIGIGSVIQIGPYEIDVRSTPYSDEPHFGITDTRFLTTSRMANFAGKIEKTPLTEVLQGIEFNKKTGTLYVDCDDEDGFLVFASGKPIHAQFGDDENVVAVIEMLRRKKGNFFITDDVEWLETNIEDSITKILIDFSKLEDEAIGLKNEN